MCCVLLRSKNLKARRARDVFVATQKYKGLEPLILQGNAEADREREIETKSQSHSEDDREEDKRKGNSERGHTE